MTPEFTSDFFSQHIANFTQWLGSLKGQPALGLEIGCYEGRSTLWLMENVLTHPKSRLWCVDTWGAGEDLPAVLDDTLMERFLGNLEAHERRLRILRGRSDLVLARNVPPGLDFVYVDGSHVAQNVLTDAVMSWPLLKAGGL